MLDIATGNDFEVEKLEILYTIEVEAIIGEDGR